MGSVLRRNRAKRRARAIPWAWVPAAVPEPELELWAPAVRALGGVWLWDQRGGLSSPQAGRSAGRNRGETAQPSPLLLPHRGASPRGCPSLTAPPAGLARVCRRKPRKRKQQLTGFDNNLSHLSPPPSQTRVPESRNRPQTACPPRPTQGCRGHSIVHLLPLPPLRSLLRLGEPRETPAFSLPEPRSREVQVEPPWVKDLGSWTQAATPAPPPPQPELEVWATRRTRQQGLGAGVGERWRCLGRSGMSWVFQFLD